MERRKDSFINIKEEGKKRRDSFYQGQEAGKQEKNQMGLLTINEGVVNRENILWKKIQIMHSWLSAQTMRYLCVLKLVLIYIMHLKTLCDEQMNQLAIQSNEIYEKDEKLKRYRRIRMKAVKEKEQLQKTLDSWKDSSKNIWRLIDFGMSSNSKVGLGFEIQSNNDVLSYEEEMNFSVFNCSKEDSKGKPLYSRFTKTNDFKGVPHPLSGDYTPKPQEEIDDSFKRSCGNTSEHSFETESESLSVPNEMSTSRLVKVNRKNWNDMMERELGEGYSFTKKKCFVCGSLNHLIKDCDYYEKKMAREAEVKRVVNTGNGVAKPVWTNANRINHSNKFVPRSVQLNAGRPKFNSVRPNINTGRTNINSGRPKVNAVSSNINIVRSRQPVPNKTSNSTSPKRPQMNQMNQRRDFSKSYSSVRRPFAKTTAQMSHSNAVMGNWGSAVKTSASYNWRNTRPNFNYNSGPTFVRTVNANGPQGRPKPVKAWMPDENQILLKVPRHHNMYSFDMKTPTPAKGFACLIAKATSDESKLWHRRLDLPHGMKVIGTKWVYRNKRDERGVVVRNKARLVAQGYTQEEGIDYDEVFAPVARIEAIRLFLAFASFMGFIVFQMDVKSAFLYGTIDEEVYFSNLLVLLILIILQRFIRWSKLCMDYIKLLEAWGQKGYHAGSSVTPKTSHLNAVKRIFKYLKGKPNLGLWYPRESPFDLEAFSDSDYDKSGTSTTEAEYVAAANCCGQVLWVQNQLLDYGFNFMNTKIHIDNESTICIVKNPVYHSKTKHIEIRHHFIRDCYEKKLISVEKIHTDLNVADLLTKPFDGPRFNFLVVTVSAGCGKIDFCCLNTV
ncbi:putative ribonuclease H-like domain-containing protein [Tanacetum coccineum]